MLVPMDTVVSGREEEKGQDSEDWVLDIVRSYSRFLSHLVRSGLRPTGLDLGNTPIRIARSLKDFTSGVGKDPKDVLTTFEGTDYNEMIIVGNIDYVSLCAHHFLPFIGEVQFAYIPNSRIVGLSKVPRMVEIISRRPQIQEEMTQQIVDVFCEVVKPIGCGVVVTGTHTCTTCRGVRKPNVVMKTQALRGIFMDHTVKAEFLEGIR